MSLLARYFKLILLRYIFVQAISRAFSPDVLILSILVKGIYFLISGVRIVIVVLIFLGLEEELIYLWSSLEHSICNQLLLLVSVLFIEKFGLDQIPRFDKYLYQIMIEQLNGYEIEGMSEEDFKHIGGPILLNYTNN